MRFRRAVALVLGALLVLPAAAAARTPPVGVAAAKPYFDSRAADHSRAARAGTPVAAARPSEQPDARGAHRPQAQPRPRGRAHDRLAERHPAPAAAQPTASLERPLGGGARADDRAPTSCAPTAALLGLDATDLDGLELRPARPTHAGRAHRRALPPALPTASPPSTTTCAWRSTAPGACSPSPASPRRDLAVDSVEPAPQRCARRSRALAAQRRRRAHRCPCAPALPAPGATTSFAGGDFARLVLFGTAQRRAARLARDLPRDARPRSTTRSSTRPAARSSTART